MPSGFSRHKTLVLAQAVWLQLFDPQMTSAEIAKYTGIPHRTIRRYSRVARRRDPQKASTGLIWDWDPDTLQIPPWPSTTVPFFANHDTTDAVKPTLFANRYLNGGAITPSQRKRTSSLKEAPAPQKRKLVPSAMTRSSPIQQSNLNPFLTGLTGEMSAQNELLLDPCKLPDFDSPMNWIEHTVDGIQFTLDRVGVDALFRSMAECDNNLLHSILHVNK